MFSHAGVLITDGIAVAYLRLLLMLGLRRAPPVRPCAVVPLFPTPPPHARSGQVSGKRRPRRTEQQAHGPPLSASPPSTIGQVRTDPGGSAIALVLASTLAGLRCGSASLTQTLLQLHPTSVMCWATRHNSQTLSLAAAAARPGIFFLQQSD